MSNGENWKELTERMVDAVGARKDVAKKLGVSDKEISLWCNPEHDRFIPLDHLADLDAMAGDIFLSELARRRGFELVPLKRLPADIEAAVEAAVDMAKDAGDLTHEVYDAQRDGDISNNEERVILAKLGRVYNDGHSLERALA